MTGRSVTASGLGERIGALAEPLFAPGAAHGVSLALVAMVDGEPLYERYGVQPANQFEPERAIGADTPLISWSVAKSVTHAALGAAVHDGIVSLDRPVEVDGWAGTPKAAITLRHLLSMRSGLAFVEDYDDVAASDCLAMLFGDGMADMAAYAAGRELLHPPGAAWSYSSGTTNIICRVLGDALGDRRGGGGERIERFVHERVFAPLGMRHASMRFDAAGTFLGSSYVHASAWDFAHLGEAYRRGGMVGGRRVLDASWVAQARRFCGADPDNGLWYGRHWWMFPEYPGSLAAVGFEGQFVIVVPDRRLVLVHLGKVDGDRRPALVAQLTRIIDACPVVGAEVG